MSGHSHAKTVKRTKDANDAKRGKIFSKIARMISVAASEGGDPATNARLRQALEKAKDANMPKENIERAIKRGTGEEVGAQLEEVMYEVLGPGGVNIILEGITDNKNRTLSEIKQILQRHGSKLASEGSVRWAFEKRGVIILNYRIQGEAWQKKEDLELAIIEAGAEDFKYYTQDNEEFIEVITKPEELERVKQGLKNQGIETESAALGWVPKQEIEVSEKDRIACEKLFDDLDENEAIQEIYSNLKT